MEKRCGWRMFRHIAHLRPPARDPAPEVDCKSGPRHLGMVLSHIWFSFLLWLLCVVVCCKFPLCATFWGVWWGLWQLVEHARRHISSCERSGTLLPGFAFRCVLCSFALGTFSFVRAHFHRFLASQAASDGRLNREEQREVLTTVSSLAKSLAEAVRR